MMGPYWENLDHFLDPGDFGVQAVLHPANGDDRTVSVIYDGPFYNTQLGEYEVDTIAPRLTGKASDFEGLQVRDTVDLPGHPQPLDVVGRPQPDGTGMAVLPLALPPL